MKFYLNNKNGPAKPIKTDKEKQETKRATNNTNLVLLFANATFLVWGKLTLLFLLEMSILSILYPPFYITWYFEPTNVLYHSFEIMSTLRSWKIEKEDKNIILNKLFKYYF